MSDVEDYDDHELMDAEFDEEFVEFIRQREENPDDHEDQLRQMEEEEEDFFNSFENDYVEGEDFGIYDEEQDLTLYEDDLDNLINEIYAEREDETYEEDEDQEEHQEEGYESLEYAPRLGAGGDMFNKPETKAAIKKTQKGIEEIQNIIKPAFVDKVSWLAKLSPLGKVYECAKELATIHTYYLSKSDDSDLNQMLRKLDEVIKALRDVEDSVKKGFSDLIAANYAKNFNDDVQTPVDHVYDLMIRSFEVRSTVTKDEFIEACKMDKYRPLRLLNKIKTDLTSSNNIIEKQLKANGYAYKTFKEWYDTIYYDLNRLIICNTFYYGWEKPDDQKFRDDDSKYFMERAWEVIALLIEMEKDRMKTFHKDGYAAKDLLKKFDEIKQEYPGQRADWGTKYLSDAASNLKKKWIDANGPSGFYIAVIRGYNMDGGCACNDFEFNVGDKSHTTVLKNAAYSGMPTFSVRGYDGISVVLIQPITPAMVTAHKKKAEDEDTKKKVMKILEDAFYNKSAGYFRFNKVEAKLLEFFTEKKPLLIMFSTDFYTANDNPSKPRQVPYAYRMVGEASSTTTDLRTEKFDIHRHTGRLNRLNSGFGIRALLQIIYQ